MEHFNAWGNAVDPETFRIFKNTIATVGRESTAYGNIRHYQEGVFEINHIDNKEFLVKYKEKDDKIFLITGITRQQPSSVMKLLENDDSVRETSKEANTGTSINEPLDLKSGHNEKFEGSGTCIPEYRKPIENYESTPAKQAKLSDFVLDSIEEVNMINEVRGKMYLHALSRQLFVEKHSTSISQKVPSFKGTLTWQSAEVEEKSSIVYLHVTLAFTDKKYC